MIDPTLADVQEEIVDTLAERDRIVERRDANPHLDHWKTDWQLDALDRHLTRLRALEGAC